MYPICRYISLSPWGTICIILSGILIVAGIIGDIVVLLITGGGLLTCACFGGFFEYVNNSRNSDIQTPKQTTPAVTVQDDPTIIPIAPPVPVQPPTQIGACAPAADIPTTYPDPDPDPEP
jgi:hypothetical protein